MKQPQLLGAILKTIGVWNGVSGIAALPQAVRYTRDYGDELAFLLMLAQSFAGPIIYIVSSYLLILSTDWFVQIAYPDINLDVENSTDDENGADVFGVMLKATGIWYIIVGIVWLPYESAIAYTVPGVGPLDRVAYAGIQIVCGCFLLFATDWFVRIGYRARVVRDEEFPGDLSLE